MRTVFRRYGVLAILLVGAALSASTSPREAFAESSRAVIAVTNLLFPEGTIFVGRDLYLVDYARSDVLHLVGGKTEIVWHQDGCGANGLVAVPDGLLVACFDGGTVVKISLSGKTLTTIRGDAAGGAFVAPNDFTPDRKGGLYLSDSGSSNRPGKVFYLAGNGVVREVASGIRFANGIGVSPDGSTLYVAESPTGKVLAFPIRADGSLGAPRDFIRLRDVLPIGRSDDATPELVAGRYAWQRFRRLVQGWRRYDRVTGRPAPHAAGRAIPAPHEPCHQPGWRKPLHHSGG